MVDIDTMSHGCIATVDRVVMHVKALMMKNWGFGEGCSTVYAVLLTSREPLSAEEISRRTNYAYSSTISYLNTLMRWRLVERVRSTRKNVYIANVNFVELIKAEHEKLMAHLKQLYEVIQGTKDLEHLGEEVERAIAYLKRVESVAETGTGTGTGIEGIEGEGDKDG